MYFCGVFAKSLHLQWIWHHFNCTVLYLSSPKLSSQLPEDLSFGWMGRSSKNPGRTVKEQSILLRKIHKTLLGLLKFQEGNEPLVQQPLCFSCSQLHAKLVNTAQKLKYNSCAQIVTDRKTVPQFLYLTWNRAPKQIIGHFFRVCNKACTWHNSGDPPVKRGLWILWTLDQRLLSIVLTRDNEANGHH